MSEKRTNYLLRVNRYANNVLVPEVLEFEFYEDVFQTIEILEEFDNVKVTDIFGVVIHEQKWIATANREPLPFNDCDSYA